MSTDVPTTGDWSEADRLLAIAWSLDKQALCPGGCGQYLDESTEHDASMYDMERMVCGACEARDMDRDEHKSEPPVMGELAYVRQDF